MSDSRFTTLRNAFVTGLLLLAPLTVTWIVFSSLVEKIGGGFRPYFFFFVPDSLRNYAAVWNLLATFVVLAFVTLLGYTSRYVFGRFFGNLAERLVQGIPGVSTVYNTVKQVVETFGAPGRHAFSKVVLVEFPRKGSWSLGFLTGEARGELAARLPSDLTSVFIPTTPNPTSGFLIYVPRPEVVELDMSVGDGMKMIISGGAVIPPWSAGNGHPVTLRNPRAGTLTGA